MKKYILGAAFLLAVLVTPLASAQASGGLTTVQAASLIAVVKASPSTPASAFINFITAFSDLTVIQATSLIAVVQSSPSTPASDFVPLITSFTSSTPATQTTTPAATITTIATTAAVPSTTAPVATAPAVTATAGAPSPNLLVDNEYSNRSVLSANSSRITWGTPVLNAWGVVSCTFTKSGYLPNNGGNLFASSQPGGGSVGINTLTGSAPHIFSLYCTNAKGENTSTETVTVNVCQGALSGNRCAPSISSFIPMTMTVGSNTSIIIYGSGFKPGATIVYSGTSSGTSPAASSVSSDGTQMTIGSYVFATAGTWTFQVKNPDGQMSGVSGTISVTAIAPTVQNFSMPSTVNLNDTFTATWTGSSNATSYQVSFNGGAFTPLTTSSPWNGTAAQNGLSAGTTYSVGLRACAGSLCGAASYRTFSVAAAVAPTGAWISASPNPVTVGQTIYLTWGATNASLYTVYVNGAVAVSSGSTTSWSGPASTAGAFAVSVSACNTSNQCTTASASVTVNPAPIPVPTVPTGAWITASPNPVTVGQTIYLTWGATNASLYTVSVNGAVAVPSGSTTSWSGPASTAGAFAVSVSACNASNQCTTASANVNVTVALGNTGGSSQTASALNAFSSALSVGSSSSNSGFSHVWNYDLQIGSPYFADVNALQTALAKEDVYAGDITGGFYNQTFTAVKAFQNKYGIKESGYVGWLTRAKLNSLYSK